MPKLPKTRRLLAKLYKGSRFGVRDSLGIKYGWLLPGGFGIDTGLFDHADGLDILGVTNDVALVAGWVRKVGHCNYEIDLANEVSISELTWHLRQLAVADLLLKNIYIETFDSSKGEIDDIVNYTFTVEDFRHERYTLSGVFSRTKYEIH